MEASVYVTDADLGIQPAGQQFLNLIFWVIRYIRQ